MREVAILSMTQAGRKWFKPLRRLRPADSRSCKRRLNRSNARALAPGGGPRSVVGQGESVVRTSSPFTGFNPARGGTPLATGANRWCRSSAVLHKNSCSPLPSRERREGAPQIDSMERRPPLARRPLTPGPSPARLSSPKSARGEGRKLAARPRSTGSRRWQEECRPSRG